MPTKDCKRLAEVDFPVASVSKHAVREKSIRYGHPSTLHLWWARRPLGACRAMLLAIALPDPLDPHCPNEFKERARNILKHVVGVTGSTDKHLRTDLLSFIAVLAQWESTAKETLIQAARSLVSAAWPEEKPVVADFFAGGGSIPLEALRLGCEATASDLNPVSYLILKTMLQDIPGEKRKLTDELRRVATEIQKNVADELSKFYPAGTGAPPISYIWARTVTCDTCGLDIPLIRTRWLSKNSSVKHALNLDVLKHGNKPTLRVEVTQVSGHGSVKPGTVMLGKVTCPNCNTVMPPARLRSQITQQQGCTRVHWAKDGTRISGPLLIAVVCKDDNGKKSYRSPTPADLRACKAAAERLREYAASEGQNVIPTETFSSIRPSPNARGLTAVTRYGITGFGHLYLERQLVAILTFAHHLSNASAPPVIRQLLALTLSRVADYCSAQSRWDVTQQRNVNSFGRQALPMLWDFAELVPFRDTVGSWDSMLRGVLKVVERLEELPHSASVQIGDAAKTGLPDETVDIWFTDPPYYDSVPYADLSDFFFVWLKRFLPHEFASVPTEKGLTPKRSECVWNQAHEVDGRPKDPAFFEQKVGDTFKEARRVAKDDGIGCVVFAHKTTEGWEAILGGMVSGGWVVVGSWPIATEQAQRLVARDSAALATSVHLICRPRSESAPVGDWSDVLRELPERVGIWIERLQQEGVRGADLVFACIGPAMEVYSRYRRVEDAEGREIPLGGDPTATEPHQRGFLAYVWETVGRMALEQILGTAEAQARNGGAGALEEDSRLTALFLWTLQSTEVEDGDEVQTSAGEETAEEGEDDEEGPKKKKAGYILIYDVARRFAQPLGIHLDKWEGRIIETDKGIVRLLPVAERATQLFGDADAAAMARRIEQDVKAQRNYTFAFMQDAGTAPNIKTRGKGRKSKKDAAEKTEPPAPQQVTTLDRVHAAMLLQSSGQTNGLRALLREEQQRGPDFIRLANALSALYPKDSDEKRLLDAMLLAVPRN